MTDTKKCLHCGATIYRQRGEWPARWEPRKYCSRYCAARSAALRRPEHYVHEAKDCAQCGTEFSRKPEESNASWTRHTYCSRTCAGRARRGQVNVRRNPKPEPLTAKVLEERAKLLTYFISRGRAKPGDDLLEVIKRTSRPGMTELI